MFSSRRCSRAPRRRLQRGLAAVRRRGRRRVGVRRKTLISRATGKNHVTLTGTEGSAMTLTNLTPDIDRLALASPALRSAPAVFRTAVRICADNWRQGTLTWEIGRTH